MIEIAPGKINAQSQLRWSCGYIVWNGENASAAEDGAFVWNTPEEASAQCRSGECPRRVEIVLCD